MTLYLILTHCPSAEEYSSLFPLLLLSFLEINATKFSIPFGRVKRQPQTWWSSEVKEVVKERHRIFASAHRSNQNCQAYFFAYRHAFSVILKAKAEIWQATCSPILNQSILPSVLSLILLSRLLIFSNCSSPGE